MSHSTGFFVLLSPFYPFAPWHVLESQTVSFRALYFKLIHPFPHVKGGNDINLIRTPFNLITSTLYKFCQIQNHKCSAQKAKKWPFQLMLNKKFKGLVSSHHSRRNTKKEHFYPVSRPFLRTRCAVPFFTFQKECPFHWCESSRMSNFAIQLNSRIRPFHQMKAPDKLTRPWIL